MNQIIIIEGNVGAGKTTFLNYLQNHGGYKVIQEPVSLWQNVGGHDLLGDFFLTPDRWAFTAQSYILTTRIDQMIECQTNFTKVFIERSIYSGLYCFAKVAHDVGWMNDMEWELYQILWKREILKIKSIPMAFIYLRTPAEICFQRMAQRARKEEKPIQLDYLKRIEQEYDLWFLDDYDTFLNIPVLRLDFSQDMTINPEIKMIYLNKIQEFIKRIEK